MKTNKHTFVRLTILLICLVPIALWLIPKIQQARLNGALLEAVKQSNYTRSQALLDAGADPDVRENGYPTVLILATDKNDEAIIRLLLSHKANVNATGAYDNTALQYAVNYYYHVNPNHYPSAIELLLEHGANPNLANSQGQTSLEEAKQLHSSTVLVMCLGWHDEALPLLNKNRS